MQDLKQSTAMIFRIGPFLDTDGNAVTGLSIAQADIQISKAGGAFAQTSDAAPTTTHDVDGHYQCPLTTTDTNTVGILDVQITMAGAIPVPRSFRVLPANVYDSQYGADVLQVHAVEISNDLITASAIATGAIDSDAIASDAIGASELATDAVEEIADAVWDEELTGATHNVPSSAGRRLRNLQDFGVYEGGAVWIDTVNGTAGTTDYENGTVNNPVDSIADALTLAASVGLSVFHVLPGSAITLAASVDNYEFQGYGYSVALGGQSTSGTSFHNATITGNDDGANGTATVYVNCVMGSNTLGKHRLQGCQLSGDIVLAEAADCFWDQCFSGVAGTGTPSVDLQAALETKNLSVRHYSGGLEFKNFGAGSGTHTASVEGHGQVVLNVNCAGGTIAIRGNMTVTDNAGGAVTLSDDARLDTAAIADAVWDEVTADHDAAGSVGKALADIEVDAGSTESTVSSNLDATVSSRLAAASVPTNFGDMAIAPTSGEVSVGALSTAAKAEVESECNDALVAQKLDHLVAVAESDDPVDNSIVAKMASKTGDWSTHDDSTDSLEAIRDRGDAAWAGGGGSSSVIVGPIVAVNEPGNRLNSPITLEMHRKDAKSFRITTLDADGAAVDLSAMTLRFVVNDGQSPAASIFEVELITTEGTSNEIAVVPVTAAQSDLDDSGYHWQLLDITDTNAPVTLAHGPFKVYPGVPDHV